MTTIGDLQRRRRHVVGRDDELQRLDALLTGSAPPVTHLYGIAGIGKSTLLNEFLARAEEAEVFACLVDCQAAEPTSEGLVTALAAETGAASASLGAVLEALRQHDVAVLALDNYEAFRLMDSWVRDSLVPALPAAARVVLSGRDSPSAGWVSAPEWRGLVQTIAVGPLDESGSDELLRDLGATETQFDTVRRITRGHPLALTMAGVALRERPDLSVEAAATTGSVETFTQLFRDAVTDEVTRRALDAGSMVRRVTIPLLRAMLPDDDAETLMARLSALPFASSTPDGLAIHDAVRSAMSAQLKADDPTTHTLYRRRAWRVLQEGASRAPRAELWRFTADMLFMLEQPVLREGFFPSGAPPLTVRRAQRNDTEPLRAITEQHDGPESSQALNSWLTAHPEAFFAITDREGEVVGYYVAFDPETVSSELLESDPVTRSWSEHLATQPLTKPERALFLRRWLSAEVGERPSAAQGAAWVDVKRTYMEMRPTLRRVYLTVREPEYFVEVAAELGFVVVGSVEVDGIEYVSFLNDFGDRSVDGWLARLVGAEIDAAEATSGLRTILFTDVVSSTPLLSTLGDERMRQVMRDHDAVCEATITERGGRVVKTIGDAFMAEFSVPSAAIEAAIAIQRGIRDQFANSDVPVRLRIGINAGEPIVEDDDLHGASVVIAKRMESEADEGGILVSDVVRQAVAGKDFEFEDRGEVELKGFEQPVRAWAVRWRE